MQIRDPDTLLAIIAQLKSQFGHQIAELHDALAVANVKNAALEEECKDLRSHPICERTKDDPFGHRCKYESHDDPQKLEHCHLAGGELCSANPNDANQCVIHHGYFKL